MNPRRVNFMLLRRSLILVAVVVAPAIVLSGPAGAKTTVDATNYTASCSGLGGTVKFSPALGVSTPMSFTATVKLTLTGCAATPTAGGSPVIITKGTISGRIS